MPTLKRIHIATEDGVSPCDQTTPDGFGPWPGVLLLCDAGGPRPAMHRAAEHLAKAGYLVLAPDIFYRAGDYPPFDMKTVFSDPTERARIMALIGSIKPESAQVDLGIWLDALRSNPEVKPGRVGVLGYCLGGVMAFRAAAAFSDRVAAAACFHPGPLVTEQPDSPHLSAPGLRAHVYLGLSHNDRDAIPEQRARLEQALEAAGVPHLIEVYEAAHGYAVDDTPVFDAAAHAKHQTRALELFGAILAR